MLGVGGFLVFGRGEADNPPSAVTEPPAAGDATLVRVTDDWAVEVVVADGSVATITAVPPDSDKPGPITGDGRYIAIRRDLGILVIVDPVAGSMTELVLGGATNMGSLRFGDSVVFGDPFATASPVVVDLATAELSAVVPTLGLPADTTFDDPWAGRDGAVSMWSRHGTARFVAGAGADMWWLEGRVADMSGDVSLLHSEGESWQLRRMVRDEQSGQSVTVEPFMRGHLLGDDRAVLVTARGVITEVNFTDGSQRLLSDVELVDVQFADVTDDRVVLIDAVHVRVMLFDGTELAAYEATDLYDDGEEIQPRPVGTRCALYGVTGGATDRSVLIDLSNGAVLAQVPGRLGAYRSTDGCSAIIVTGSGTSLVIDGVVQTLPGDVYAVAPDFSQAVLRVDDMFVLHTVSTASSVPLGEEFDFYQWVRTG